MKNLKNIFLLLLAAALSGCSGGFLYTDAPALEFSDIDYGFPVKKVSGNPTISYIEQGSGDKVLLLVHGLASNAGFWRYNIEAFSKEYRVIAIDLPGYGKSDKKSYPYSMTFYADEIAKFLKALKINKVYYLGHSMGGQIGIHLAIKHPEMIERLVLASPAGIEEFQRGEGDWLRSVFTSTLVKQTNEEGIRRNLNANFYTWCDDLEWMVEERARMAKSREFDEFVYAVIRSVNAMLDEPTFDKLGKISMPALIVYGANDLLIPNPYLNPGFTADVFKKGKKDIPNCELAEIPECGHMLQIDKSGEFNTAVLEYLRRQR